jgi:hypothetical protein
MGWIRWTGKALEAAGKLAQAESFEQWAQDKGKAIVEKVALQKTGSIFKSAESKAKADIWNDLAQQFKSNDMFASAMQDAITNYPARFSESVDTISSKLPRPSVLHMLVVPPFVLREAEHRFWQEKFDNSQELANLKGGSDVRAYFFDEMVTQLETAFTAAAHKAKPTDPIQIPNRRWIIGFDRDYAWSDSNGHYYVFSYFDQTAAEAKGKPRKEAERIAAEELEKCKQWLFALSPEERRKLATNLPAAARSAGA